jgi:hypothetical protein
VALTRHGNGLDELIFFEPVPSGETPFTKAKGTALPLFRKGMTSLELKEVIESGLALSGFHDIQTLAASAQKMDKANASRLEMSMASEKGPRFHGQVLFAEYNEKLYLIVFIAEATTYYPMVWPEAEAMLASMQIL